MRGTKEVFLQQALVVRPAPGIELTARLVDGISQRQVLLSGIPERGQPEPLTFRLSRLTVGRVEFEHVSANKLRTIGFPQNSHTDKKNFAQDTSTDSAPGITLFLVTEAFTTRTREVVRVSKNGDIESLALVGNCAARHSPLVCRVVIHKMK